MPLTRPAEISNGVSLSDKLTRQDRPFVSEQATLDAFLPWDGFVEMLSPNKDGIAGIGAQDDVLTWADALTLPFSSWALLAAVVAQIEREAGPVAVFGDVPVRCNGNHSYRKAERAASPGKAVSNSTLKSFALCSARLSFALRHIISNTPMPAYAAKIAPSCSFVSATLTPVVSSLKPRSLLPHLTLARLLATFPASARGLAYEISVERDFMGQQLFRTGRASFGDAIL